MQLQLSHDRGRLAVLLAVSDFDALTSEAVPSLAHDVAVTAMVMSAAVRMLQVETNRIPPDRSGVDGPRRSLRDRLDGQP